ncbi:MAG: uracil-DNA glycosylase [Rhodospirillaceae bacterium]|nr:uracil-DNA glycosylase [Rhodospirillaceae bacterium]
MALNVIPRKHEPKANCSLCPRLHDFRLSNKQKYTDWYNGPVYSFGKISSRLLIVGLAPGLRGANRTSRPFTGDWAGDLLFSTLSKFKLSQGTYMSKVDDGLELVDCRITNAVRCVPPENKPIGSEIKSCNNFLRQEINSMVNLKAIITLGQIAHNATLDALNLRKADFKFKHGGKFVTERHIRVFSSFHCSRYNTNTGRLTPKMFESVFEQAKKVLNSVNN